jgi:perosamine synthetase
MRMILQMEPSFGYEEREALVNYLARGPWLTEFKKTAELENKIASFVGAEHCIMVPNCTLALYSTLMCLGIGPGDDVIVPAFTMIASANAVRMTGARVVFCDIDPRTLCIPPSWWTVSDNRAAVIAVALNGRSHRLHFDATIHADTDRTVYVIEDAAQALGSRDHDSYLGTIGIAGCYSLGPLKIISSGQGGCIVTDDDDLAHRLRMFKTYGREQEGSDHYQTFGINLRYTDLQAVIALEQMERLPYRIARRRGIFSRYQELLASVEEVEFVPTGPDTVPWFVDILCRSEKERDALQAHLRENNIGTRAFYPPLHKTPVYQEYNDLTFPIAEDISSRGLWLPSSVQLKDEEITQVCDAIREFY